MADVVDVLVRLFTTVGIVGKSGHICFGGDYEPSGSLMVGKSEIWLLLARRGVCDAAAALTSVADSVISCESALLLTFRSSRHCANVCRVERDVA